MLQAAWGSEGNKLGGKSASATQTEQEVKKERHGKARPKSRSVAWNLLLQFNKVLKLHVIYF